VQKEVQMAMLKFLKYGFYAWKYFHLPQRKLHILAWHFQSEEIKSVEFIPASIEYLNFLNNKRMNIQKEMGNISKDNDACKKCMGLCCSSIAPCGPFEAIDFLVRKYSNNPLEDYRRIPKLQSNYSLLINHLKYFFAILGLCKLTEPLKLDKAYVCPFLTEKGCILSYEDRPITCLLYTCEAFRKSLPNDKFIKLAYLTKELQSIGYETFRLYKKGRTKDHLKILFQYWICI
jgi:hypothetical protein